jgi:hypothetical protein
VTRSDVTRVANGVASDGSSGSGQEDTAGSMDLISRKMLDAESVFERESR